ncbi:MAG TPA: hypothetical protein VGL89_02685 [Candidatus Koribacter sp.]|jgi:hypothetical protein
MEKPKPYVSAALLCEKIIQDKNDDLISLIRIADRIFYRVEGLGLPEGVKPMIALQAFISLKAGPVTGDHVIKIESVNPKGERRGTVTFPTTLQGEDNGQNIILNLNVGIDHDGLYWFDVLFDDELLTRIPVTFMASAPQPSEKAEPKA